MEICHVYPINWYLIMYSVYFPPYNDQMFIRLANSKQ